MAFQVSEKNDARYKENENPTTVCSGNSYSETIRPCRFSLLPLYKLTKNEDFCSRPALRYG
jgi:hypothetical protein